MIQTPRGGNATVGQTVRLTCTSASLPPACFSWELNDQPVTAGQSGSGVLSLQIFSTNQSGRYACIARDDVTGGTSKQQIDLAIVGELMALCGTLVTDASVRLFFGLTFIFLTGEGVINHRIDKFTCHLTRRSHNFHPPTMIFLSGYFLLFAGSIINVSVMGLCLCLLCFGSISVFCSQ